MKALAIIIVVAACKSPTKEPPPAPPPVAAPVVVDAIIDEPEVSCAAAVAQVEVIRDASPGELSHVQQSCEELPWSAGYRACIVRARRMEDIHVCDRRAFLALGIDLGGPECGAVVEHLAVVEKVSGDAYADLRASLLVSCGAYSRAGKECILAAKDHDGLVTCGLEHSENRR